MMCLTKMYAVNMKRLIADREACAADGIECGNCPLEKHCMGLWDRLQEATQVYKSGVPTKYFKDYLSRFAPLQQEKWDHYNQFLTTRGGNHGSPVR